MNNNPSPGNKAGGLTTLLEESLGAVAKSSTSNLQAVYEYTEPVTGRGSAYGCAPSPSPSLKLSTNSALWRKQEDNIDLNCGEIIDGSSTVAEMGLRIFELVLATASGAKSKSELHGYGQSEFVPWQVGAVM